MTSGSSGMSIDETPHGSPHYEAAKRLRERVLREPLGMRLRPQDIAGEETQRHLVALAGNEVIGTLILKPLPERTLQLRQMVVCPGQQKSGTGKQLMLYAERDAQANGFRRITFHARAVARGFYEKLGYAAEGEPFKEVGIPHIIMSKPLKPEVITRALLSVSDKTGLIPFAQFLHARGVELLSTGGTARSLRDAGIAVTEVSDHTGFPEIMDGRVKTLHPKVHGGLLAMRDDQAHQEAMDTHGIAPIDLVVINLYPFEATVAKGAAFADCIENIDIGGPSMVRSAAKNHAFVTIIVDPADYTQVMEEMEANSGATTLTTRQRFAAKAYSRTAAYDSAIAAWFDGVIPPPVGGRLGGGRDGHELSSPHPNPPPTGEGIVFPPQLTITGTLKQVLHYGENAHQKAAFYTQPESGPSLAKVRQMQGSNLSYNNLNDASAAFELVREFERPAVAIIKHANPCGVAVADSIEQAFAKALACDPVSAYGGIIATNRPLNEAFCAGLGKLFLEVLIAPDANEAALALLANKKKLRLLLSGALTKAQPKMTVKTISGGFLYQEEDALITKDALQTVTQNKPDETQMQDLHFAFTVAKHVKSNTIVLARDGATIGIGAGQMSRIDSTRIACWKAKEAGLDTRGCVLASDAFFPFADNVEMAAEAGVAAIIQPGGSIRDEEVIASANRHGMAMVFTGIRHFKH